NRGQFRCYRAPAFLARGGRAHLSIHGSWSIAASLATAAARIAATQFGPPVFGGPAHVPNPKVKLTSRNQARANRIVCSCGVGRREELSGPAIMRVRLLRSFRPACDLACLLIPMTLLAAPAAATWKAEYANNPPEVQAWYRNAELTKAAQY